LLGKHHARFRWVYRDRAQFEQERMRRSAVAEILASQRNIHVRVKGTNELMHENYVGLKNMWCTHQPTPADDHKSVSYTT
jgi:hypothetical protein